MKLTKENVYVNLYGKTKEELTDLWEFLTSNGEKPYRDLESFLEYSKENFEHIGFSFGYFCGLGRDGHKDKTEVTIQQLKEILQPMENKEYLLITEDGYEVKEKENVSWIINDEYKYELTLCENHKTLIENSEGVYKVFKIKEKALEYHNKLLLSKNSNLPLTEQLEKAKAEVKRLKEEIIYKVGNKVEITITEENREQLIKLLENE